MGRLEQLDTLEILILQGIRVRFNRPGNAEGIDEGETRHGGSTPPLTEYFLKGIPTSSRGRQESGRQRAAGGHRHE